MKLPSLQFLIVPLAALCGCATQGMTPVAAPPSHRIVCLVPGVTGDCGLYEGMKKALLQAGMSDVRVQTWGAPTPLFVLNYQWSSLHAGAEKDLATRLADWHAADPNCQIDLIGHSAGCGVILGALGRDTAPHVRHVVLLAPSVSPGYDLSAALSRIDDHLDVFHSDRDILALKLRTGTFGTYDNVRTPAAGNLGFRPAKPLPPEAAAKLRQHPYDPAWKGLGNDGDHCGATGFDFVKACLVPLMNEGN